MSKTFYKLIAIAGLWMAAIGVHAGNPDRQGEAGAHELLINPWARSAGLHTLNTSSIMGVEAMRLNIAGLSHYGQRRICSFQLPTVQRNRLVDE